MRKQLITIISITVHMNFICVAVVHYTLAIYRKPEDDKHRGKHSMIMHTLLPKDDFLNPFDDGELNLIR